MLTGNLLDNQPVLAFVIIVATLHNGSTVFCASIAGAVGNWLEVVECIETLNGNGPADLEELVVVQSGQMLLQSGVVNSRAEGISMCKEVRGCSTLSHQVSGSINDTLCALNCNFER